MLKAQQKPGKEAVRCFLPALWFPAVLLFQEMVLHLYVFGSGENFGYILLFSLALGGVFDFFCCLWGKRGNRIAGGIFTVISTIWLGAQTVYYTIFRTFLVLYSVGNAGQVLQFWRETLSGMAHAWLPLTLILLPGIVYFIWVRRAAPARRAGKRTLLWIAGLTAAVQLGGVLAVNGSSGAMSPRDLYYGELIPELSVNTFGALTTLRLDLQQLLGLERAPLPFGGEAPAAQESAEGTEGVTIRGEPAQEEKAEETAYAPNVMELDLDTMAATESDQTLKELDEWFAAREPTDQNEYTGLFAGKNLIWFTAESFSRFAVDPELTPTLYKLANTGFVFENFYNPLWWTSTSDGEYVACTSLVPKPGCWSLSESGDNEMYFCMGNQLRSLGYDTRAYHDHSHTYYNRDVSHPNMGYDFKAVGNGLRLKKTWPESDLEMMQVTLPEYVGDKPFHAYYMTVSGHMNYSFLGNSMSAKHQNEVGHETWSEEARAYLACQMELDRALEYTLDYLEQTGHGEDTVICLSADHYPYGMQQSTLDELNGGEPLDMRFDVYRSTLILWCGSMKEPVPVTKVCSGLDILPTLSNLFGLEYDSRLLMGRDILSDSPGLVALSDRRFLTDYGRYETQNRTFTPVDGVEVTDAYVQAVSAEVNDLFLKSRAVLETDYYGAIGLTHGAQP